MFENILTKETISFKDLEEIAFKIACEFANEILRNMLEEYDKKVMDTRDTKKFRHKGKETTTVKAKTGIVEYTRTKYIQKQENSKNKCVYLTDEILNIKEMKRKKVKTKEIYTFKQGSLEGYPQLKKILENKEISELIYR